MTVVINRSVVPSTSQVCIACRIALGSAEKSVQGVRGRKEGPLHEQCATPAERRVDSARQLQATNSNGNGASNPSREDS